MNQLALFAVYCVQMIAGNTFNRMPTSLPDCPLVASLPAGVEQQSMCTFTVLSLSTYIYRPSTEMNFMLLSTSRAQEASYYNVEVTDARGKPVGQFTKGDNICNSGTMLTHKPKAPTVSRKISFSWQTPSSDLGTLFFRFSVGAEEDDGEVRLWLRCPRQAPLAYFEEIPPETLHSIENPLDEQNSYRDGGTGPTANPPHTNGIIQESPSTATLGTPPVKPNYKPSSRISTSSHMDSDGYSWCKPFGGPRFQIVAGTGCSQYTTYPNADLFSCYPGLIFSVTHCVCSFMNADSPCTLP